MKTSPVSQFVVKSGLRECGVSDRTDSPYWCTSVGRLCWALIQTIPREDELPGVSGHSTPALGAILYYICILPSFVVFVLFISWHVKEVK